VEEAKQEEEEEEVEEETKPVYFSKRRRHPLEIEADQKWSITNARSEQKLDFSGLMSKSGTFYCHNEL